MTDELLEFDNTVEDAEGLSFVALVLGEEREDGRWIGRIRFTPADGSSPLETDRETTQPDHDDLIYWARGLTYFYLEGALDRARRRADAASPEAAETARSNEAPTPRPAHHVPRLELVSMDPTMVQQVIGAADARPGTARQIPDAGILVYEGQGGADGTAHLFAVQFGSRNAGAIMANWLWSRLHGIGVDVRVDGRPVELTNDALSRALVG